MTAENNTPDPGAHLYPLKEGASQAVTSLSTEQRHFAQGRYAGEP